MSIAPVSLAGAAPLSPPDSVTIARPSDASGGAFSGLIDRFLGSAVQNNDQATAAVRDLAVGRTDNLHEVMLQVAQADLSFRLILEIRNRLTDAYQEITKMQF